MQFKKKDAYNKGDVHAGFQGEINKVWDDLNFTIADIQDRNIYITGHSWWCNCNYLCKKISRRRFRNQMFIYIWFTKSW